MNTPIIMDESDLVKLCQELTKELEQCRLERDEANATLKAIAECVGSDEPMAVRGVVEMLDCVKAERDEAQAKCAEMRKALKQWVLWYHNDENLNHCIKLTEHAVSLDCGRGWVRVEDLDLRLTLGLLTDLAEDTDPEIMPTTARALDSEISRLSQLIKDAQ